MREGKRRWRGFLFFPGDQASCHFGASIGKEAARVESGASRRGATIIALGRPEAWKCQKMDQSEAAVVAQNSAKPNAAKQIDKLRLQIRVPQA